MCHQTPFHCRTAAVCSNLQTSGKQASFPYAYNRKSIDSLKLTKLARQNDDTTRYLKQMTGEKNEVNAAVTNIQNIRIETTKIRDASQTM